MAIPFLMLSPNVLQAARAMGLSTGTHGNTVIGPDFDNHKWREWIRKEEMIRYVTDSPFHGRTSTLTLEPFVQDI